MANQGNSNLTSVTNYKVIIGDENIYSQSHKKKVEVFLAKGFVDVGEKKIEIKTTTQRRIKPSPPRKKTQRCTHKFH
jgi:hypothetical protein